MDKSLSLLEGHTIPIAIVGIGCRLPGGVNSAKSYWELLLNQIDAVGEIPSDRMDVDSLYDPRPAVPGKIMTRWGGFLDDIDKFDAEFFGISPREADRLDPQQRLLLEVAWQAMEDAGELPNTETNRNGGVFVGCWLNDYEGRLFDNPDQIDFYMTTGSGRYSASGRLSYFLGMQGPSITIDTACSSSLVAVHLACQSLRNGECSLALAGGVNVILQPNISIAYSQSKMMAPDGRCKFGDERGNGYVRSEGAALIALKRLDDAIADNNPIYALIMGSAVNNDGRTSGTLTTPGTAGQEDMLRKAYRNAQISPGQVQYVEAHGTGTRAGDPVEIQALGAVLSEGRPAGSICRVGSVKTNLGHTEGAAGISGLIKVALSLKNKYLPASLHFETPNPAIPWDDIPIRIQAEGSPWPEHEGPAIAGVSAFGIAGTNAHVVLQEPPAPRAGAQATNEQPANRAYLLPLSAHNPAALRDLTAQLLPLLDGLQPPSLYDLGYTTSLRRTHHDFRAAIVASSVEDLKEKLAAFADEWDADSIPQVETEPRKILFVFPGQGSQWAGMGLRLMEKEPAFRAALERCDRAIQPHTGWSLIERLCSPEIDAYLEQIDFIQPALFAMQVALAELWRAWGIEPAGVIGHSMGEVAAAHIAGVLSLEAAAQVICLRSQLMKTVSGKGAMYSVDLSYDDALASIQGYEDRISIAVNNSPRSTVLSGEPAALEEVVAVLRGKEVLCRQVKVDVAAHSPIMDTLRPSLEEGLAELQPHAGTIPVYSTVTGSLERGETFDIAYWGSNLRQPVRFSTTLQQALQAGYDTVIEISPHPVLLAAAEQCFNFYQPQNEKRFVTLPSSRRGEDEQETMLQSWGALYTLGCPVDWQRLYPHAGQVIALPPYPWQREHYWLETKRSESRQRMGRSGAHPLSGQPVEVAGMTSTLVREIYLTQEVFPEVFAHRLYGTTLLPASAFIEIAWAAADELYGSSPVELNDVFFERDLLLSEDQAVTVQVILTPAENGEYTFQIYSRQSTGWLRHVAGQMRRISDTEDDRIAPEQECLREDDQVFTGQSYYRWLGEQGIQFDVPLHAFEQVSRGKYIAVGKLAPASSPRLLRLDPLFQLIAAALEESDDVYLPASVASLRLFGSALDDSDITAQTVSQSGSPVQNLTVTDSKGRLLIEMSGVHLKALGRTGLQDVRQWLYDLDWQPVSRQPASGAQEPTDWLILADQGRIGQAVARALTQPGSACTVVFANETEQISAWLRQPSGKPRGILYLWGLDYSAQPESRHEALQEAIAKSCLPAVEITKQAASSQQAPHLWLITRGAQAQCAGGTPVVEQAPLWGLGRVIAEEHPDLWGGLIDLDPALTPEQAAAYLAEEVRSPQETQLAFYGQQRLALRMVRHTAPAGKIHVQPNASYLITGGLGGIGMGVAHWLVQQGAKHLILMGRTPIPARREWTKTDPDSPAGQRIAAVLALESSGAFVHLAAVDAGDEAQLRQWLEDYQLEGWPAIRGVFHAAGVTRDQLVTQIDPTAWETVMRPKVSGAWLLHSLLPDLDFFVSFSSVGSILGPTGQGSYAAANAFLDALAHYRRACGEPALSINWGVWDDVGMAKGSNVKATQQALESQGVAAIQLDQGIQALAILLSEQNVEGSPAQSVVLPVNWEKAQKSRLSANRRSFFSPLLITASEQPEEVAQESIREKLSGLEPEKRRRALESFLQQQIAQVLKLPPARISPSKPLGSYGLDSLMGIELRGRLEAELDITLSATFIWNYPTLAQMTPFIAERMGISLTETTPVPAQVEAPAEPAASDEITAEFSIDDLLSQLEAQSDESVQQALQNDHKEESHDE